MRENRFIASITNIKRKRKSRLPMFRISPSDSMNVMVICCSYFKARTSLNKRVTLNILMIVTARV